MAAARPLADSPLLRYLVQHRLLERAHIDAALAEIASEHSDLSVLEWLARRGQIAEEQLTFTVAGRLRLPRRSSRWCAKRWRRATAPCRSARTARC